ncbi:peptidoglycan-binding protein [Catenuloplanes atrovinosus]|uniref:Peptidoglycan hydrolase-like protein with peptidoglycan-binding domain n=1 Tax=Catenuloplanes atrovinosus TaxID=137266 RepID=A0AAE3YP06_9ACTN|nr:peptidoglycan-binding protein [Catenuloplanes atrovinosus]MDR7277040.1 peptidoglycan hydrolase-like protein with peptidoglycan-binding domain [Catenuloplanes atrovinosus]
MRRRTLIRLAAGGAVAVGAGVGLRAARDFGEARPAATPRFDGATEPIVRGDLEGSTAAAGTLRYAGERTVQAAGAGTLTGLPAPGSVVRLGGRLFAVDNVPVPLLHGTLPAWRDFEFGMADGPDVEQLEHGLRRLGHLRDAPGPTFTWVTANAIDAWQKATGLERTGRLPLGSVLFADGDLRVGTATARVGDRVGPGAGLYAATSTTQIVEVDLKLADQRLAVTGTEVGIRLPGGATTEGRISSVGTPTESAGQEPPQTVIPVVVTLSDPKAAASLQQASVTVTLPSDRREDVLSVPVGALLAIDERRFGVEIVGDDGTARRTPVTTGLFAGGRVEVSGEGLAAGQRVVVPRR